MRSEEGGSDLSRHGQVQVPPQIRRSVACSAHCCRVRVVFPLGLVDRAEAAWEDEAAFEGLEWCIPSIGALVVADAIDTPGSPPPGIPTIAALLATFKYSGFITLCLGCCGGAGWEFWHVSCLCARVRSYRARTCRRLDETRRGRGGCR